MTLVQIIGLAVKVSIFAIVFSTGLRSSLGECNYLFRHPGQLARSIFSMNIVMPVFATAAVLTFNLLPVLKIALVALALSPVPPILPVKQIRAGGSSEYAIGLRSAAAIAAMAIVPLAIEILSHVSGVDMRMPVGKVASIVFVSVLIPLMAGVVVRLFAPGFAARIAQPVYYLAFLLLVIAVLPILVKWFPAFLALLGNGVIIVLVLFSVIGLAVGHFLGGPDPGDRTVLALATATRHPAVAMAIAAINFPSQKSVDVVILWHLILGALVSVPYVMWRRRVHARAQLAGGQPDPARPQSSRR